MPIDAEKVIAAAVARAVQNGDTGQRRAILVSAPAGITLKEIDGLFRGYNAAMGYQHGLMAVMATDMPVAEGGHIKFDFSFGNG